MVTSSSSLEASSFCTVSSPSLLGPQPLQFASLTKQKKTHPCSDRGASFASSLEVHFCGIFGRRRTHVGAHVLLKVETGAFDVIGNILH